MPGPEFLAWFDPRTREVPDEILEDLQRFVERWQGKVGREQQLAQPFLEELCVALRTPRPADGALPHEDFQYEKIVRVPDSSRSKRLDLYKREHFVLEAKCGRNDPGEPGTAPVRGTAAHAAYIERAYNEQARVYASLLPEGPPPLLIVVDIGHRFWIWRRDALDQYPGFHSPQRIQIPFARLADEESARVLWSAFEDPAALDPARYQEKVTNGAARLIAELAAPLQERVDPARVAKFLIQCLFCMFAEDVDLLPTSHFTKMLVRGRQRPELFPIVGLFVSHEAADAHVFWFIEGWYNTRRLHSALGMRSPVEFERDGSRSTGVRSRPQAASLPPGPPSALPRGRSAGRPGSGYYLTQTVHGNGATPVGPDEYRDFEARIRRSVALARLPGPEGDTERLRLDVLLRLRDLPADTLTDLADRVAALVAHPVCSPNHPGTSRARGSR